MANPMIRHDSELPGDVQESINIIGGIDDAVEITRASAYWLMGRVLNHMKNVLGQQDPKKTVAEALGQSERTLGYCMTVNTAYDWDTIQKLTARYRLRWSLLRELASPRLDPHRDNLIAKFEEGAITAQEMAEQVKRLQATVRGDEEGKLTDGTTPADIDLKFKKMVDEVRLLSEKLNKKLGPAIKEFRGDGLLIDALVDGDGNRVVTAEAKVLEMIDALNKAVADGVELLYRAGHSVLVRDWPFTALEERLAEFQIHYDADGKLLEIDAETVQEVG